MPTAKAVTLKDKNGNYVYPVTTIDLVNGASQPTVTTQTTTATYMFAPTWYKREYTDGRIIWSTTCVSPTYSFGGGPSWGYGELNLPMTFDSSKMACSVTCRVTDAAVSIAGAIPNGGSQVQYSWNNNYGSTVNTTVTTNVTIIVFPD